MALDQDDIQQAMQTHPSAQAMQAPPMMPEGERIESLLSRPQPQNWLQRRAQVDPSGGVMGQIKRLGLKPYLTALHGEAQAVPAGAQQESQRILEKPSIKALQKYFAKGGLTPQQQQLVQQYPQQARAGKGLTDVAAYTGATALAPESLLGQAVASGIGGAAVAPTGHTLLGGMTGAALPFAPKIGLGALKSGAKAAMLPFKAFATGTTERLAKLIEGTHARMVAAGKLLYKRAFSGTEGVTPELGNKTQLSFDGLKKKFTPGSDVRSALDNYKNNESLENLHFLKSKLNNEKIKLDNKEVMSGKLGDKDETRRNLLKQTNGNISTELEQNFKKLSPEKYKDYRIAQDHHKNNVIPFESKKHRAVRNLLLDPDRPVEPTLYSQLLKRNVQTNRVRKLLGVSPSELTLGRFIHHKTFGLPTPLVLAGGGLAAKRYGKKVAGLFGEKAAPTQ